jgi:hypothetical protein
MNLRTLIGLVLLAACAAFASGQPARDGSRVLIVCDERAQMDALAKFLRDSGKLEIEIVDQEAFPAATDGFRAIVAFVHKPFTDRVEKALIDYTENGGRLISLHHSISSSKRLNTYWLGFCGMTLPTGSRERGGWYVIGGTTVSLVNLRPDHYITSHNVKYPKALAYVSPDVFKTERNLPALDFAQSEVFLGQQIADMPQKEILFGLKCLDPKTSQAVMIDRGGWVQRKGRGRHFYFQVGHATGDFQNAAYCQVLLNAVTWQPPKE